MKAEVVPSATTGRALARPQCRASGDEGTPAITSAIPQELALSILARREVGDYSAKAASADVFAVRAHRSDLRFGRGLGRRRGAVPLLPSEASRASLRARAASRTALSGEEEARAAARLCRAVWVLVVMAFSGLVRHLHYPSPRHPTPRLARDARYAGAQGDVGGVGVDVDVGDGEGPAGAVGDDGFGDGGDQGDDARGVLYASFGFVDEAGAVVAPGREQDLEAPSRVVGDGGALGGAGAVEEHLLVGGGVGS